MSKKYKFEEQDDAKSQLPENMIVKYRNLYENIKEDYKIMHEYEKKQHQKNNQT